MREQDLFCYDDLKNYILIKTVAKIEINRIFNNTLSKFHFYEY